MTTKIKDAMTENDTVNLAESDYMTTAQQAYFRERLLDEKTQLLKGQQQIRQQLQEEGTISSDLSDQATQEEEFFLALRTKNREKKLIKKIDATLRLIDTKNNNGQSYGYCKACSARIGIERLKVRPTADLCIDCKNLAEEREKQQA